MTWLSSDNSVATVDKSGLISAIKNGNAIITAKSNDESGVVSNKLSVTVKTLFEVNIFPFDEAGTVNVNKIKDVPLGSIVTVNDNVLTINGITVTATPSAGCNFVKWLNNDSDDIETGYEIQKNENICAFFNDPNAQT